MHTLQWNSESQNLDILQISQICPTKGDFGVSWPRTPTLLVQHLETSHAAATSNTHPPVPCAGLSEPLYPKRWKDLVLAFGEIASGPYSMDVKVTGQELRSRKYSIFNCNDCYTKFWINVAVWYFQSFAFPAPIEMGLSGKYKKTLPENRADFLETVTLV